MAVTVVVVRRYWPGSRGRDVKTTEGRGAKKLIIDTRETEFIKEGPSFKF